MMPIIQFERHSLHFVWKFCFEQFTQFNVAHILNHVSLILEKNLLDFCGISFCRKCRSGWFSIFGINSGALVFCTCFTLEYGSLGIRKSMSASFTIIDSWLTSWPITGFTVLSPPTLKVSLSCDHVMRDNGSPCSYMNCIQNWLVWLETFEKVFSVWSLSVFWT